MVQYARIVESHLPAGKNRNFAVETASLDTGKINLKSRAQIAGSDS